MKPQLLEPVVRRFEAGSAEAFIKAELEHLGIEASPIKGYKYKLQGRHGRPTTVDYRGLVAIVDKSRIARGLQPMLAPDKTHRTYREGLKLFKKNRDDRKH